MTRTVQAIMLGMSLCAILFVCGCKGNNAGGNLKYYLIYRDTAINPLVDVQVDVENLEMVRKYAMPNKSINVTYNFKKYIYLYTNYQLDRVAFSPETGELWAFFDEKHQSFHIYQVQKVDHHHTYYNFVKSK